MNKVVCVLGMHRSGTSMLSNWIHQCGLNLGENLLKADFSNQSGHFEDLEFLQLHKSIFLEQKLDTSGLFLQSTPSLSPEQLRKMKLLIEQRNSSDKQWGWKDPRTCLFIEDYLELIPDLYIITIIRDYRSSIGSLLNRDILRIKEQNYGGIRGSIKWVFVRSKIIEKVIMENLASYQTAVRVYYTNILLGLNRTKPDSRLVIELKDLLDRDKKVHTHLNNKFQLNLDFVSFDTIYNKKTTKKAEVSTSDIPMSDELQVLQNQLYGLKTVFE